jgi:hypothetical protein
MLRDTGPSKYVPPLAEAERLRILRELIPKVLPRSKGVTSAASLAVNWLKTLTT